MKLRPYNYARRDFLKTIGLTAAAIVFPHERIHDSQFMMNEHQGQPSVNKPNFIFILIDDLGWADLSCYANKFHETPNIDRLARQGMRFTDAYAASPVCSPTRASILTGQYPARIGITDFIPGLRRPWAKLTVPENRMQLPLESVTIAEVLKEEGYATACIGKWHLGNPPKFTPGNQGFHTVIQKGQNHNDKQVISFTDSAIEFIAANADRPFFLYLSHHSVHIPLEAPQHLIEKYKNKCKSTLPLQTCPSSRRAYGRHERHNPIYAAMLEHLDNNIGRIIKKLNQLKLAHRTIIIFSSDNGGLKQRFDRKGRIVTTNAPLRGEKGTLYEGGIRVPLIICFPGVVKPHTICNIPVSSIDFYPTILEMAKVPKPSGHILDGKSMLPLLIQTGEFKRDGLFWHYPHYHHSTPAGAIRQANWKLIEFYEDGRLELYDLTNDIAESNNLAIKMQQKATLLAGKLAAWRKSVGAKMPMLNPDYDPARAHQWAR